MSSSRGGLRSIGRKISGARFTHKENNHRDAAEQEQGYSNNNNAKGVNGRNSKTMMDDPASMQHNAGGGPPPLAATGSMNRREAAAAGVGGGGGGSAHRRSHSFHAPAPDAGGGAGSNGGQIPPGRRPRAGTDDNMPTQQQLHQQQQLQQQQQQQQSFPSQPNAPSAESAATAADHSAHENGSRQGRSRESRPKGIIQKLRERSRSRSRSRSRARGGGDDDDTSRKEMMVAVTSCRSDGYYNQKAPGSTFKLPRKAPTNLKLFHELAVGVKDAYAAIGAIPKKPTEDDKLKLPKDEYEAQGILWDFLGNLDFLLALVDEVAVDTVTRGALKDDATFKGLRDVIKKGNRVLEDMLVRRERKYTLFFRLVQPHDVEQIDRMSNWNGKVEKAVGAVTAPKDLASGSDAGDSESESSTRSSSTGSVSSRAGVFSRGRQLFPTGGRVRSRRATPTPKLRKFRKDEADSNAAADGFSIVTAPDDLSQGSRGGEGGKLLPSDLAGRGGSAGSQLQQLQPLEPKDELVDVIRGLRVEKVKNNEGKADDGLAALKPSWRPKADIPSSVPKLPTEYVHRHRLMKQVVSCLLDETEAQQSADGNPQNSAITCVTSRHGDKAGNGKSTLAIAVIQTVEVRERFADGIAWLKLGRGPLSERDIRRLYEDLYRQLIVKEMDMDASVSADASDGANLHESLTSIRTDVSESRVDRMVDLADSVRRFQGGDLEGIKEDLGRMIVQRNMLICLDDVWRVEDAKWFIFDRPSYPVAARENPYKILITTRIPALLGNGTVLEVFVRILSEHEAVKLLLSTAGRRPYGGRNSAVFNQSKIIVKGCGNSPLGILLVGSMLRQSSRNWNLKSPVWIGVFNQCSLNLEEAAQMRSFKNAFTRIVDMSFFSVDDVNVRIALRRCFIFFAMAFRSNDWMLSGRGIPESITLKFFDTVISAGPNAQEEMDSKVALTMLENLRLVQRARHSISPAVSKTGRESPSLGESSERSDTDLWDDLDDVPKRKIQQFYTMHDSLKAVAERMAERNLPAFTPDADVYTYFSQKIKEENRVVANDNPPWEAPLRFLFDQISPPRTTNGESSNPLRLSEEQVHEVVATSIVGGGDGRALTKTSISEAMRANQLSMQVLDGGDKFEEYAMAFLPEHLMFASAHSSAAEIITDTDFVCRRVFALGIMEATGRQVADVLDLRSFSGRGATSKKIGEAAASPSADDVTDTAAISASLSFDIDNTACDACRIVVDEVYKVTNSMGSSDSLGMATCLATVGEALLKCRQPRDAMLRLEEAVSIYRGLLGPYHVFVAHALHSVAKALTKLGETRVALLKFAEAARIYETCNATLHYDSIANAQALASLLVDIGDVRKAEAMFEEVIAMKQTVYGDSSVPVAKTINSYAILLAKHGRMKDALSNYEIARATYMKTPPSMITDPEFELRCSYDVTLITLNIASIYSKKGDLARALQCYEDGVAGLEHYETEMAKFRETNGSTIASTKASSHKHLVAALGRIGSIKAKMGDDQGALEAYLSLIKQVDEDSPLASHVEKAKAHIKCATIFRKREGEENRDTAVTHLREALRMYKALHAPNHKDTIAISTTLKQWLTEDKQAPGAAASK